MKSSYLKTDSPFQMHCFNQTLFFFVTLDVQEFQLPILFASGTFCLLVCFFIGLIILFQHQIRKKQEQLYWAIINSQEQEQQRIGKDLHDESGPTLAIVSFQLDHIENQEVLSPKSKATIISIRSHLEQVMQNIRATAHNLMPSVLLNQGLAKALDDLLNQVHIAQKIRIHRKIELSDQRFDEKIEIHLYRIFQELLSNCLKHAQASELQVVFRMQNGLLYAEFEDNGKGFEPNQEPTRGIGIKNTKNRIRLLKGSIHFHSRPGQGTKICLSVQSCLKSLFL